MIVKTQYSNKSHLEDILSASGLNGSIEYVRQGRDKLWQFKVLLKINPITKRFRRLGFPDFHTGKQRHINSVCYHGYYAFAKLLFEIDPYARIESVMTHRALGHDLANREGNWESEAYQIETFDIGSMMRPLMYGEACDCPADIEAQIDAYAVEGKPDYDETAAWAAGDTVRILRDVVLFHFKSLGTDALDRWIETTTSIWLRWAENLDGREPRFVPARPE